ncbi:MAG: hypothetical protein ACI4NM_04485 [Bullifex sp.]
MKRISLTTLLLTLCCLLYAVTPITPVIIADNSECLFKVVAYDESYLGFILKAQCENRSSEKTYTFSIRDSVVDGLMEYSSGYAEVPPGKKANMNISFYGLKKDGITFPSDILLVYAVHDSDDWLADPVAEGEVHVYPMGEDKKVRYSRTPGDKDMILLSGDGVRITMTESVMDGSVELKLYLENYTDKEVMFSLGDPSVNGYVLDPYWAKSLLPETSAYSAITWSQRRLEENLIFEVEDIEFSFRAYDYDDWFAPDIAKEKVILSF